MIKQLFLISISLFLSSYAFGAAVNVPRSAKEIKTDISNFDNNLSSADTTVQKALDTLDDTAGGSTSPGGSDTQVQYNSSGSFAGDAGFTYDAANDIATIQGGVKIGTGVDQTETLITYDRASTDATIIWDETNDEFDFNYPINVGGSSNTLTFGNGETIDNANDGYLEFQGSGGADDTDLRFDLDGTHPIIESPTDTTVEIAETLRANGTAIEIDDSGTVKKYPANKVIASFTITNGDNAIDDTVTDPVACVRIPNNSIITGWYIYADQSGSIVLDVWKDTFANHPPTNADSIAGTEKPTLSSAVTASDTSLTSMTTDWNAGDVVCIEIESAATITKCWMDFIGYND